MAQGTWGPNWQWTRVNGRGAAGVPLTINPRTFTFTSGTHTIRLRERDPLTRVDRVIVTNDFDFVPTEGNVNTFKDTWPSQSLLRVRREPRPQPDHHRMRRR